MPSLDPATLLLVSCATTTLVGLQFIVTWRQLPAERSLALWGLAHLIGSVASVGLALRGLIPDWISVGGSNAAMIGAYGLIWGGVARFERRPFRIGPTVLGPALWILLCLIPAFYHSLPARVAAASLAAGCYCLAAAWQFWRGRAEMLASRRFAVGLLAAYALCYLARVPAAALAPLPSTATPLASPWVAILCLAAMLFSIASAFTFIGLVKERREREQRLAARTDPLTGVANRRAFVELAGDALAKRDEATLLLFDLDRFKSINDRYGHEVGDAVLIAFCAVAEAMLPERATFGRLGGEEFGCLLGAAQPGSAYEAADEVRRTFGRMVLPELPGLRLSVSVGIAHAVRGCDFDRLLRQADTALYAAKERGRDRVEVAELCAA